MRYSPRRSRQFRRLSLAGLFHCIVQKLLRLAPMYYTSIFLFVLLIPAMQDCGEDSENVSLVGLLFTLSVRALPSYGTVHLEACTAQSY